MFLFLFHLTEYISLGPVTGTAAGTLALGLGPSGKNLVEFVCDFVYSTEHISLGSVRLSSESSGGPSGLFLY